MFGIDDAIDQLAVEDRVGWSGAAFSARVVEITAAEERLAAEKLRCLGEWDAALAWAEDGSLTATGWLARETPVTQAQARDLMKGTSTILDLGRATPVVSAAQRKALAIRDRGCVEPGCTAPPEWCDAHHKLHWILGGPTDLWNLELRCRRHHIKAHHGNRGPPR
jgi:hypothetical protein